MSAPAMPVPAAGGATPAAAWSRRIRRNAWVVGLYAFTILVFALTIAIKPGYGASDFESLAKSVVPIVAPFAGRIIGRKLTRGEVVETTENLFVIADLSQVWVQANIPEKDIPFVHSIHATGGTQADVRINAYPREIFKGTITYAGHAIEPSVSVGVAIAPPAPESVASVRPRPAATKD